MRVRAGSFVSIVVLVIAACSPSGMVVSPSPDATPSAGVPTVPTTATSTVPADSVAPPGNAPPDASLAAEGGDPVPGQLGTYTWRESGSDSPWLPGARLRVGAGEPLTVGLDPAVSVESWRARSVPAEADGPSGATTLGDGPGTPGFRAPGAGAWTVEVHVVFGGGLGDASYFWRLEVSG